jgi:phosphoglycolate phosphatase-like HAD superfamily hydrolase
MSKNIESDYQRTVTGKVESFFLDGTSIEIVRAPNREPPKFVLFDFDGTLSLVREGWPEVMVPMMVEFLRETGTDESDESLQQLAYTFVMELNGKQTIYQMMRLAEEVAQRGGKPKEPSEYKHEYHQRLMVRIESRREKLRSGEIPASEMVVPGSHALLDSLRDKGAQLYLASGTDENYVREEVELLGLSEYFGEHVYGAVDDFKSFSKAQVIDRILTNNHVDGAGLLGFGDGYVEIENIKSVGGTAVAVASDESGRSGKPDLWKRDRLIGVGADLVVPDFGEQDKLIAYLWNQS